MGRAKPDGRAAAKPRPSATKERVPAITISAAALLGADDDPAELDGYGPITPGLTDDLIGRAHRVFYRRLITDPLDHTLIDRDPRRRRFDGPLNGFVRARDRHRCRQPGCDCGIGDITTSPTTPTVEKPPASTAKACAAAATPSSTNPAGTSLPETATPCGTRPPATPTPVPHPPSSAHDACEGSPS